MSKVVLYLTSLESGGAADCTFGAHRGMLHSGHRSYVAVAGKKLITPEGDAIEIPITHKMSLWDRIKSFETHHFLYRTNLWIDNKYAVLNKEERICYHDARNLFEVLPETPDYIFVHWVSNFANAKYVQDLQRMTNAKVFFVMIDEAILSGGCHYCWQCNGISNGCRNCPMTTSWLMKLHIRWNFIYKQLYLPKEKNVILGSQFDENKVRRSMLWKDANIFKIYATVDDNLFKPAENRIETRKKMNLPLDKRIIFFGCSYLTEARKGMSLLASALARLTREDAICMVAGKDYFPTIPVPIIHLGHLNFQELAEAYQAADIFVCSSLEDSGPQMINMALMSGCPVVSFETGVALDFVKTGETGYLAKWGDDSDLLCGINFLLDLSQDTFKKMSAKCRDIAVKNFSKKTKSEFSKIFLSK